MNWPAAFAQSSMSDLITWPWFASIRVMLCLFMFAIFLWSLISMAMKDQGVFYMYYLTNWTVLVVTFYFLVATFNTFYIRKAKPSDSFPWYVKMQWWMFDLAFTSSLMVVILFWTGVYNPGMTLSPINFFVHGVNFVLMFIELFFCAIPVKLLHFYKLFTYGLSYVIFTIIWTNLGLTGPSGNSYMYPVIFDFSQDDKTVPIVFAILNLFVFIPFIQTLMWSFVLLRDWGTGNKVRSTLQQASELDILKNEKALPNKSNVKSATENTREYNDGNEQIEMTNIRTDHV